MMEVSQNVELPTSNSNLPIENNEINHDLNVNTVDFEVSKKTDILSDDEKSTSPTEKSLTNETDKAETELDGSVIEITNESNKCINDKERDTGSDLDDLLHKISSIVDCEPKKGSKSVVLEEEELVVENAEKEDEDHSVEETKAGEETGTGEQTATIEETDAVEDEKIEETDEVEGKKMEETDVVEDEKMEEADKVEESETLKDTDAMKEVDEVKDNDVMEEVETVKDVDAVKETTTKEVIVIEEHDSINENNLDNNVDEEKIIETQKDDESIKAKNQLEEDIESNVKSSVNDDVESIKSTDNTCDDNNPVENVTNNSKEDVFMDALESISSSSDIFDEMETEKSKVVKEIDDKNKNVEKRKVNDSNGLDDISSEDSNDADALKVDKNLKREEDIPIIDLDSSDECLITNDTTEVENDIQNNLTNGDGNSLKLSEPEIIPTVTKISKEKETKVDLVEEEVQTTNKKTDNSKEIVEVEKDKDIDLDSEKISDEVDETPKSCDSLEESVDNEIKETQNETESQSDDLVILDSDDIKETTDGHNGIPEPVLEPMETDQVNDVDENKIHDDEIKVADKTQNNDVEESKGSESDDEVIFFEPVEKSSKNEVETKTTADENNGNDNDVDIINKEDDVVLVSEDEDELDKLAAEKSVEDKPSMVNVPDDQQQQQPMETESSSLSSADTTSKDAAAASVGKELQADNSDNACDNFDKTKSDTKEKPTIISGDGNSNSSSNLLRPSKRTCSALETSDTPVDKSEKSTEQLSSQPKRLRQSIDEETPIDTSKSNNNSTTTSTTSDIIDIDAEKQETSEPSTTGAKRSHNLLCTTPSKRESLTKKPKTDDSDSNSSNDGQLQIDLDAPDNSAAATPTADSEEKEKGEDKKELKEVSEVTEKKESEEVSAVTGKKELEEVNEKKEIEKEKEAIKLVPQPELKSDVKPIRLEFLKNFRKSFDKMTRNDLEELVLQKVVEAMLVKSEFADIRRQVDKYESTLANYSRKIAEITKQFYDLDTVHKRVLKDLELKNSHYTAPVRITRAVGLQVGMAIKKSVEDPRAPTSSASTTTTSMPSAAALVPPKAGVLPRANVSPMRSPLRGIVASAASGATSRPGPQSSSSRNYTSVGPGPASMVRRGCMQKVTPQRPVNVPTSQQPSSSAAASSSSAGIHRQMPSLTIPTQSPQSKVIHVAKHITNNQVNTARARVAPNTAITQQVSKEVHQALAAGKQQAITTQRHSLPKYQTKVATKVRPMPTASVPMTSIAASSSSSGYQQPSLTPAKPKEKNVIDLTDEDDVAAAAAAVAAATAAAEATARLRQTAVTVKRSVTATNSTQARSSTGSIVRVTPNNNIPRSNPTSRQSTPNNVSPARTVGSSVTMQIRSENTPPAAARLWYSHPAPLPSSPAQPFNPAWKLPPARPVIRISLHDTGIVISWTLEDVSKRFADCATYQIYAYQETIHEPSTDSWRHVGDVKAMLLPMAVTLNQFQENQRYYFAVRGVDDHQRYGAFSAPKTWS